MVWPRKVLCDDPGEGSRSSGRDEEAGGEEAGSAGSAVQSEGGQAHRELEHGGGWSWRSRPRGGAAPTACRAGALLVTQGTGPGCLPDTQTGRAGAIRRVTPRNHHEGFRPSGATAYGAQARSAGRLRARTARTHGASRYSRGHSGPLHPPTSRLLRVRRCAHWACAVLWGGHVGVRTREVPVAQPLASRGGEGAPTFPQDLRLQSPKAEPVRC